MIRALTVKDILAEQIAKKLGVARFSGSPGSPEGVPSGGRTVL